MAPRPKYRLAIAAGFLAACAGVVWIGKRWWASSPAPQGSSLTSLESQDSSFTPLGSESPNPMAQQALSLTDLPPELFSCIVEQLVIVGGVGAFARTSKASQKIVLEAFNQRPNLRFFKKYYELTNNRDQQYPLDNFGALTTFTPGKPHVLDASIQSVNDLTNLLSAFMYRVPAKGSKSLLAPGFIACQDVPLFAQYLNLALNKNPDADNLRALLGKLPLIIVTDFMDSSAIFNDSNLGVLSAFGHLSIKSQQPVYSAKHVLLGALLHERALEVIELASNLLGQIKCPSIGMINNYLDHEFKENMGPTIESSRAHTLFIAVHDTNYCFKIPKNIKHAVIEMKNDRSSARDRIFHMHCLVDNGTLETLRFLYGHDLWTWDQVWFLDNIFYVSEKRGSQVKKVMIHFKKTDPVIGSEMNPPIDDMYPLIDENLYKILYKRLNNHSVLEEISFYTPATEFNYHKASESLPRLIKGQPCPQFKYLS